MFKQNKKILLLYCTGTLGVLLFTYVKNFGCIRHHGHFYILFIVCYWFFESEKQIPAGSLIDKTGFQLRKYLVPGVLITQLFSSVFANICDVKYTFSNNQPVADYLKEKSLDTLPILGDEDYPVSGVAGILGKDIYFMRDKFWGRFIKMDGNWGPFVRYSDTDMFNAIDKISGEKKSDVIVILNYPYNFGSRANWNLLKAFDESIKGENYFIYRVKYVTKT